MDKQQKKHTPVFTAPRSCCRIYFVHNILQYTALLHSCVNNLCLQLRMHGCIFSKHCVGVEIDQKQVYQLY